MSITNKIIAQMEIGNIPGLQGIDVGHSHTNRDFDEDFEEDFDDIKDLIPPKTLFMVDDKLNLFAEVKQEVIDRRDMLREKASKDPNISTACENSDDLAVR